MKKKIFYSLNIIIILTTLAAFLSYAFTFNSGLETFSKIMLIILSVLGVANVIALKNKKAWLTASLNFLGIMLHIISSIFIVRNPIVFWVVLILGEIAFIASLVLNTKFSKNDILFMLAFALPFALFVNLAPIFGFLNVFNRLLASVAMISIASLSGLSLSHLIREKSKFNIIFFIVTILQCIYGFAVLVFKQSNVSHYLELGIGIAFYLMLFIFALTIFLLGKQTRNNEASVKLNIHSPVGIMLVIMITAYALISSLMSFSLVSAKIYKSQYLDMMGGDLTLPIVEINTQNNQLPYSKEEYVNCSFKIYNCENEKDNFTVPMTKRYEDEGCVGIRLRGNSTKNAMKRPYRIKFDEKQSFFNLKENKSWVLLADYYDQSYIRNFAAFTLADSFDNLDFTPTPHHVALIINGEFKGLYLLCEQMDEKKGRANVDEKFDINSDKEFPFLVEMDARAYREGITGVDNFYVASASNHVEIKFPESDERGEGVNGDPVYDYIYEYINAVFTSIKTNEKVKVSFRSELVGLEDLVDIDSVVDYYLVNEIMLNFDNLDKSIYMHKTKNGKLKFGPIWDFDFSLATQFVVPYDQSYIEEANKIWLASESKIYNNLLKNEQFYNKVAERYNEKNDAILETSNYLKNYKSVIDKTASIDAKMWHGRTGQFQFDMQFDYVRLFLMDRFNYLNSVFSKSHAEFLNLI